MEKNTVGMGENPSGKTNILAYISLIFSLLAWLSGCIILVTPPSDVITFWFSICSRTVVLFSIMGIITGYLSLKQINKSVNNQTGKNFAVVGITLGILIILTVCIVSYSLFLYPNRVVDLDYP